MKWYLLAFQKYADFSGRSRRSEYWYFALFNILAIFALGIFGGLIAGTTGSEAGMIPIYIYYLAILIPSIAVGVRRLHDTGRSGWWLLISLLPIIGSIILLVFYCEDSKYGSNKWGPNPKEQGVNISKDPTIIDDLV